MDIGNGTLSRVRRHVRVQNLCVPSLQTEGPRGQGLCLTRDFFTIYGPYRVPTEPKYSREAKSVSSLVSMSRKVQQTDTWGIEVLWTRINDSNEKGGQGPLRVKGIDGRSLSRRRERLLNTQGDDLPRI